MGFILAGISQFKISRSGLSGGINIRAEVSFGSRTDVSVDLKTLPLSPPTTDIGIEFSVFAENTSAYRAASDIIQQSQTGLLSADFVDKVESPKT